MKRGCRQGDPIAPYLFLLVAEILSRIIENSSSIKGITIGKHNYKLTQFADDTTIFWTEVPSLYRQLLMSWKPLGASLV